MSEDINSIGAIAVGIGGDARTLATSVAETFHTPIIVSYNFPGVLGTVDYPIASAGGSGQPTRYNPYALKWADAINASTQPQSSKVVIQSVAEYALDSIAKNGVFSSLIPGAKNGTIVAGNYNYQRESNLIKNKYDTALPPEFRKFITPVIDGYNKLFDKDADSLKLNMAANHENNVLIMGPYSKGSITLGNGNNIIINSPAMFEASLNTFQRGYFDTTAQKSSFWFFYPSSQGLAGSNTINVGNGNNLIYYDSSTNKITTKNGDNIFVPSFGSFNWARNDLQAQLKFDPYYSPAANNSTWFTPMTLPRATGDGNYSHQDTFSIVGNYGDGNETHRDMKNYYSQMTYVGGSAGLPNNPTLADNKTIDASKLPKIGGQSLVAGSGNDVFYGVDPIFYQFDEASGSGVPGQQNRTVFRIADGNTKNERFSYQNFETVSMMGGEGNDVFYLGNPTRLQADGLQYIGDFAYKISTNHREIVSQSNRENLAFGEIEGGADIIEVNLSANLKTFTNTMQSFEPRTGQNPRGADFAKAAVTGYAGAANTWFQEFTKIGATFKYMPAIDLGMAAISAITEMVDIFTPPEPAPIVVDSQVLSQPLGQWRQAIAINDWNPATVINIKVDPTSTTMPAQARWSNVQALIEYTSNGSTYDRSTTVYWKTSQNPSKNELFVIEGLGDPSAAAAYHSYNFRTGQYQKITDANLAFMGTIAPGVEGINPIKDYTAKNGFVFSSSNPSVASMAPDGTYQFYWNDSNSNIDLTAARNSASTLSVQFDSRSLGWFWQPSYDSTLPKGATNVTEEQLKTAITLNENKSKLWVVSPNDPNKWEFHTFADFKTKTEALRDALLASTYYEVKAAQGTSVSEDQKAINNLANDLKILMKVMPDLTQLQQSASAKVKIENLGQITGVDANGNGAIVYFIANDENKTVYKTTITAVNGTVKASTPVEQKGAALSVVEFDTLRDLNANDLIGDAAIATVKDDDPASNIDHLYRSVLTRTPDQDGLKSWVDAIAQGSVQKVDVVRAFLLSDEYIHQTTSKDFIEHLYLHLLDRVGDAEGVKAWAGYLDDGGSRAGVVDQFLASKEFVSLVGVGSSAAPAA